MWEWGRIPYSCRDGIRQVPGFEAETPEAAQGVRKEQTVVERGDCGPAGGSA